MAVNYNNTKTMKGAAVGTIIGWTGPISAIPKGWLLCNGQFENTADYPYLYAVIGNTYGSGVGVFRMPQIGGRALADIKNDSAYIGTGVSSVFTGLIGTDGSTNTSNNYTSNIDLNVNIDNNISSTSTYSGILSEVTATQPAYFDSFKTTERKLGDFHTASHTHDGEYSSVVKLNSPRVEGCQYGAINGLFSGGCGAFQTSDCCNSPTHYLVELNWTYNGVNAVYKNSMLAGMPIGGSGNSPGLSSNSNSPAFNPTTNSAPRVNSAPKNFLDANDSTELTTTSSGYSFNYPTTLSQDYTTWTTNTTAQMGGHGHGDINYSINTGNFGITMPVNVSDITAGNVAPINTVGNTEVLRIEADVATPSVSTTYIIKAY